MKSGWTAFLVSFAIIVTLVAVLMEGSGSGPSPNSEQELFFYCAAGIKQPVAATAEAYRKEYGVRVQLNYAGSGTLLNNLQVAKSGDIYLAADTSYIRIAREKNLLDEALPVAHIRPVIGVKAGNPKNIHIIQDLLRKDVRVALANPDAASIGKLTRKLLKASGEWAAVEKATKVFKPTVTEIANDVKLGTVDAAVIWDSTANQYPEIDMVHIPIFDHAVKEVTAGVLKTCQRPTAALKFLRYLGARDRGLLKFKECGFDPVDGDEWEETPELRLFSGAMLRPAIEEAIKKFEKREGVRITRVYNGCGILVSQMHAGARPDAYFSCDVSFMDQVSDLFMQPTEVSTNQMVILTAKGNPLKIQSLDDLCRKGLRVGLAHPQKSALGALAKRMMEKEGVYEKFRKSGNLKMDSPTGDLLVNQIRTGSLDAVIVYKSNAALVRDFLDVVEIKLPSALAVQPYAVGKNSHHHYLMERLLDTVESKASKQQFESFGFGWRLGK